MSMYAAGEQSSPPGKPLLSAAQDFRAKVVTGKRCLGTAVTLADPVVSELCGDLGFDFVWIDSEHGPFDLHTILLHVMATRGTDAAAFVRVPANDPVLIKPILEFEPAAIIVPLIRSAAEAQQAVAACKYPPRGVRGFGPRRGIAFGAQAMSAYLANADARTLVIVQIEHIDAVNELDAILRVEGLDGICIGPNDLSASMGKLGQLSDSQVQAAIDTIVEKARRSGRLLGVATGFTPDNARYWLRKGVHWICFDTDCGGLGRHIRNVVDGVSLICAELDAQQ